VLQVYGSRTPVRDTFKDFLMLVDLKTASRQSLEAAFSEATAVVNEKAHSEEKKASQTFDAT